MTKERENNIDSLRVFACFLVVTIHISGPLFLKSSFDSSFFKINLALDSFARVAVAIFVMISGRYLVKLNYNFDPVKYSKSIGRILKPLLFWTIVYIGLYIGFKICRNEAIDFNMIFEKVIKGKPHYHLWYLFMIIGLYMITPFINQIVKNFNLVQLKKLTWILIAFSFFHHLFNLFYEVNVFWALWFIDYLGYFLLGFVYRDKVVSNKYLHLVGYLLSSVIIFFLSYYTYVNYEKVPFFNYNSIFVVFSSYCLYRFFDNLKIPYSKIISSISPYTFGIYLIHPLFILVFMGQLQKSLIHELLYGGGIFLASYIIIRALIQVKWLNKYLM